MPGLKDYQSALSDAVASGRLSAGEPLSLQGLSPEGIAMMARVRRSWCLGRARRAAPLTLSTVPQGICEAILAEWVSSGGGTASFFEQEALALLDFIAERLDPDSHSMSFARFERAVIRARASDWTATDTAPLGRSDIVMQALDADLIAMRAPVKALLEAIEGTAPWPVPGEQPVYLLVAPGIDGLIREATRDEAAFWEAASVGVFANRSLGTASELLDCGALVLVAPQPD